MSLNYVKVFEDGTTEATLVQPAYGLYDKVNADDNRDVYSNGKWYPTSGGELVTNGTFDVDLVGWATTAHWVWLSGMAHHPSSSSFLPLEQSGNFTVGEKYTVRLDVISVTLLPKLIIRDSFGTDIYVFASVVTGSYEFIATTSVMSVIISRTLGTSEFYVDNISVFKSQPTLGTPYVPQFTYLSKDGKLAEVEVADGVPVDVHYDKLAPDLVRDSIQTKNLVVSEEATVSGLTVTDSFDLGQSWVDVTANRAVSVTYTNSTGRPIEVVFTTSQTDTFYYAVVDSLIIASANSQAGLYLQLTFTVPAGSTYEVRTSGGWIKWSELR